MLKNDIDIRPDFTNADDIATICRPLQKFNITYFGHVHISREHEFSAVTNNPRFTKHYLTNEYFNADIHMSKSDLLQKYCVWDAVELHGQSAKMHHEAGMHGVKHTFTMFEEDIDGRHCYHFATNISGSSINQIYLGNLDLLNLFVMHFKEKMSQSRELSAVYMLKYKIDNNAVGYSADLSNMDVEHSSLRSKFLKEIDIQKSVAIGNGKSLSLREIQVLAWLHHGKTAYDIAAILGVAEVTVHKHIANIKNKTQCYNQFQLGEFFVRLFTASPDIIERLKM